MGNDRFRCNFYLDSDLKAIHVVAVRGRNVASVALPLAGMLSGAAELRRFITEVGLDSIVTVKQLRDLPVPAFEYSFHVLSAGQIVSHVEERLAAGQSAEIHILEGAALTDDLKRALAPFESFVLGASRLEPDEGVRRVAQWFSRRAAGSSPTSGCS